MNLFVVAMCLVLDWIIHPILFGTFFEIEERIKPEEECWSESIRTMGNPFWFHGTDTRFSLFLWIINGRKDKRISKLRINLTFTDFDLLYIICRLPRSKIQKYSFLDLLYFKNEIYFRLYDSGSHLHLLFARMCLLLRRRLLSLQSSLSTF